MNLIDSSGWLEYLTDGSLADEYSVHLAEPAEVLTPTVVLFEVYKWVRRERSEEEALIVAAQLQKTELVPLNPTIALNAADIGLEHGLAMADSIVYTTALTHDVPLITSDRDFESLPGVVLLER